MAGRDNVTFSFRIDSARASAAIKELTKALERLNATNVKVDRGLKNTQTGITQTGQKAAASAVNFQTATQGMLNLSTAAVQTFTSISNLDRAQNRAKMSIIAVARAEDLLNNKRQRLKEMTEAGITSGGKYANMQREIATAEADLTVKIEKKGIEQGAVNDIYMLFATNIANVTISSMQTLAILDKNDIMLKKARVVAQKISNASIFTGAKAAYSNSIATALQGKAAVVTGAATAGLTLKVKALTVAMKGFMASNPVLLAAMVASTAAFAIHESNILGTKDALDELMGVEKDFESQVKGARDGIEDFDDSLGGLNSTVGSSLPNSFESATKVMIAFNNALRDTKESAQEAEIAVNNFYTSKAGGRGGSLEVTNRPPPPPQVNQDLRNKRTGRHFSTPSGGGQNEALANALSATGAFLMADPFAGSYALADRGDNRDRELIPVEIKPQVNQDLRNKKKNNAVASSLPQSVEQVTDTTQGNALYKEGLNMNQQFQLGNASGGMTNIPSVKEMAVTMGMSEEALEQALKDGQIDIKQLQIANQILNGDLMTIKHVADFVELTKFKQFTPELEADRLALEKAKEQDKNFAEIFRERYMGTGVSIDKTLLQLGKLEPDRKKRFESKNLTYIDGVGFDLTTERGLEEHQKFMQAKLGQLIPTVDPLDFAGITDKQKKLTEKQYTRFLGAQGLQQGKGSVVFSKNQNRILSKIRSGEISGKRAEVLITTGEDIGAAANAMDIKSALLLGAIQESQRQFNRTSADPFVSDFDRLSKTQQDFALQDRPFDELRYLDLTKKEEEELRAKLRQSTNRSTQPDPYSIFTKRVSDVQRVNMGSIGTFQDALENQRRSVSGIRGIGGRADKAIALEQARRQIEDNITITRNQKFIDEMKERDRLATLRRFGGYSSRKEFIQAGKRKQSEAFIQAQRFMFGFGFTGIKRYTGMSDLRGQLGIIARQANERRTALESAGLGYKSFNINGLRYRHTRAEYYAHERERQSVVAFNNNQYAKAKQINILQQDFGVSGFTGSALTLPSLQDEVAKQDALIKSIGLDRTEAFQIVDTAGRGREEIDDRIRFKDRMNSMSTGVSVL